MKMRNVVEIGSWMGKSTHALLTGCRGTVYAVDHFKGSKEELWRWHKRALYEDIHALFMFNVGRFQNLVVLKMDSVDASKFFADKWIDMIFIDGSHLKENVIRDIRAWMPKCRKMMCGHDLHEPGVLEALRELKLKPRNNTGTIWSIDL
jgi:predicted O-methyltransferase YrrM